MPDLKFLETVDNVITNVVVDYEKNGHEFQLFVFYEDKRFNSFGDDADDNGYYGSGFYLTIVRDDNLKI